MQVSSKAFSRSHLFPGTVSWSVAEEEAPASRTGRQTDNTEFYITTGAPPLPAVPPPRRCGVLLSPIHCMTRAHAPACVGCAAARGVQGAVAHPAHVGRRNSPICRCLRVQHWYA